MKNSLEDFYVYKFMKEHPVDFAYAMEKNLRISFEEAMNIIRDFLNQKGHC